VSKAVLDSSAVLASLFGEAGASSVDEIISGSILSAVNAAEVISKLVERGMPVDLARTALVDTGVEVVPFDLDQAALAGALRLLTIKQGLSLGDRACLALAKKFCVQAVTADHAWTAAKGLGTEIVLIRPPAK